MQAILTYDVVVVGGGSSGLAAAIGAVQAGRKVLLIERNSYFGGQATHCSLPSYCGFFTQGDPYEQVVGGVGAELLKQMADLGFYKGPRRTAKTGTTSVILDAEEIKYTMDKMVSEAGVDVFLDVQVIGAVVENNELKAIECISDEGRFQVEAKAFVDATGEANLTAFALGKYIVGDGQGALQPGTMMLRIGGISHGADIHPDTVAAAIRKGKAQGIEPMSKELGINFRAKGDSGDVMFILPDEGVNGLDPVSLTHAEMSGRRQAWAYLKTFRQFLPGCEKAYVVRTGPKIGIRETRHIIGDYTLTAEDVLEGKRFPDAIARGGWPVEMHPGPGLPNIMQFVKDRSYYDIPLRSLKVSNLQNLWAAGRIICCDRVAFASVRVMGTGFATGQAAGVAAALTAGGTQDVNQIRSELLRQNALI